MPSTVQIDFDVRDVGHAPIVGHRRAPASPRARWSGKLASGVR
jgi:hypothetical protein